jgi:ABC-type Mn2+/Zn2+ transport system ATPase subunit
MPDSVLAWAFLAKMDAMIFELKAKLAGDQRLSIPLRVGEQLFVLGANGSGKSSLMHVFFKQNQDRAVRVSAHRQSWFSSNDVVSSPQEMRTFATNRLAWDMNENARWNDPIPDQRPRIAIAQLVDAENVRARSVCAAADRDDMDQVKRLAATPSAVTVINALFRLSCLPIAVAVKSAEQVVATKGGGPEFSIAELSDGERNALVIGATVLTAKAGSLLLIDEPERHLHRSIISPLLTQLFAQRPDCAFIVSTHDVTLPVDNLGSRVLLVRGCSYVGSSVSTFEADLLPAETEINDELRRNILGARRKLLFVEGSERSLDKRLYGAVFPGVSIVPKANCREVEHAVRAIRDVAGLHWVKAFGIIDGDGRPAPELDELLAAGVYAVPAYSVEALYYHVEIQRRVAERLAKSIGGDAAQRLADAKARAITAIAEHRRRLSVRIAEKHVRARVLNGLPKRQDIATSAPVNLTIDTAAIVAAEEANCQTLIDNGNLAGLINRYPVRETNALAEIAQRLGFQTRAQYEVAVLTLLQDDPASVQFVQDLFGSLNRDIQRSP